MGKGDRYVGLTTLPPSYGDCLEIWNLSLLEPSASVQAFTRFALPLNAYLHTYIRVSARTNIHYIATHKHTYICVYTYVCMHTYIHTYIHTYSTYITEETVVLRLCLEVVSEAPSQSYFIHQYICI